MLRNLILNHNTQNTWPEISGWKYPAQNARPEIPGLKYPARNTRPEIPGPKYPARNARPEIPGPDQLVSVLYKRIIWLASAHSSTCASAHALLYLCECSRSSFIFSHECLEKALPKAASCDAHKNRHV